MHSVSVLKPGVTVPWALLLQEFLNLLLRHPQFLSSRAGGALDSRDQIIWLALLGGSRVVPLTSVVAVIVPPLVVVVITMLCEAIALLLLLVRPNLHHITEPHDGLGSVAAKISKESLVSDAVVEAVDDVLLEDVGDGGACVEESARVGS
jgi:hypothetical protein